MPEIIPKSTINVIGFDADDTLWDNEPFFREAEASFADLLADYAPKDELINKLFEIEIANLDLYGFGIKSFVLSMIETAMFVTESTVPAKTVNQIMGLGKHMLEKPVTLIVGIEQVLKNLNGDFQLIVATKGDLLDQQRKLKKSGLSKYFHHIEIMSDKKEPDYTSLLNRLDVEPEEFLMIGNSIKSDIVPVLNLGGTAIHVPYHTVWVHEHEEEPTHSDKFFKVNKVDEIENIINSLIYK